MITTEELVQAQLSESRPMLGEGVYLLELEQCKEIKSKKDGSEFFLVEGTVLETTNPEYPAGTKIKKMYPLDGKVKREISIRSVRQLFQSLGVVTDEDVSKTFEALKKDSTTLASEKVRVRVVLQQARSGNKFLNHHWEQVSQ